MALTQESVLAFLLDHGGRVKNSELVNGFRSLLNYGDVAEKQRARELFKRLVNSVAVVKQVDGVKFVVVKKRYQDFVTNTVKRVSQNVDDRSSSFPDIPLHHRRHSARTVYPDAANNNGIVNSAGESKQDNQFMCPDLTTVKVLNISGGQTNRVRKSGAVFAVIAVKSPTRDPAAFPSPLPTVASAEGQQNECNSQLYTPLSADDLILEIPLVSGAAPHEDTPTDVQSRKATQAEFSQALGFPMQRPQRGSKRHADDGKYSESVPLEPLAHEWLIKCAAGLWGHIHTLLQRDSRLVPRKDFMSGFTALHWAAKDGNAAVIQELMAVSTRMGIFVNINTKSHGGYTPLHIAAIHGSTDVMDLLVKSYDANVNERDNSGKKAVHYLEKGASAELRALLGGHSQSSKVDEDKDHTKGFTTISKLFHPHNGKKHRTVNKYETEW